MFRAVLQNLQIVSNKTFVISIIIQASCFLAFGCSPQGSTIEPEHNLKYQKEALALDISISLSNPTLLEQFTRQWMLESGGTIELKQSGQLADFRGDLAIVATDELPALAATGNYVPVPGFIRSDLQHTFQWHGLFQPYSGQLSSWGGMEYGLPLSGEGRIFVYRKDRFQAARLEPPTTWEDFVAIAETLTSLGQPALIPLSAHSLELETEFFTIAACYDRRALSQAEVQEAIKDPDSANRILSFQYGLKTYQPRIESPAFSHALNIMRRLMPLRARNAAGGPAKALAAGEASMGIVSLKEFFLLIHADPALKNHIGIASVPGSRFTFDFFTGERLSNRANAVNRIPYLGFAGWTGMVRKTCENPAMAWDFLSAIADPDKFGSEMMIAGHWGIGPNRFAQLEERGRHLWYNYDLNRENTEKMISCLKDQIQSQIANQCYRLRLPNVGEHTRVFDQVIRPALLDAKEDGSRVLSQVADGWNQLWRDIPMEKKQMWIRMSCGLAH